MELLVLGLVATIGFASYALWARGQGNAAATNEERTVDNLQVGDVVQHLGTDFLVEGSLTLAEEDAKGPGPRLYRLVDGARERYLYAASGGELLLLDETTLDETTLSDALEHERQHFRIREQVRATALRHGSVGSRRLGGKLAVRLYAAGAAARLLVLEWPDHLDAFMGERVSSNLIEVLPGAR